MFNPPEILVSILTILTRLVLSFSPGAQGQVAVQNLSRINDDIQSNEKRPQPFGKHIVVHICRLLSKKFPQRQTQAVQRQNRQHYVA